jgi:hypothetical protein
MHYPTEFRDTTIDEWKPLTEGRLVPIVADGNFWCAPPFRPKFRRQIRQKLCQGRVHSGRTRAALIVSCGVAPAQKALRSCPFDRCTSDWN